MKKNLLFVAVMLLGMQSVFAQNKYVTFSGASETIDRLYGFSGSSSNPQWNLETTLSGEDWTYETMIKVDPTASIGDKDIAQSIEDIGATVMDRSKMFELYLVSDDNGDFAIRYNVLDADNIATGTMNSGPLQFGNWIHVAITSSSASGTARFFVNGNMVGSSTDVVWQHTPSNSWIGFNYRFRGENTGFLTGSMDNVRISKVERYSDSFDAASLINGYYTVDDNTLIQLNLDGPSSEKDDDEDYIEVLTNSANEYGFTVKIAKAVTWETHNSLSLSKNNTTEFGIYPNPVANSLVTIQAQNNELLSKVEVFNTLGKSVMLLNVENKSKVSFDVSGVAKGLYFVRASTNYGVATQKLVVE
jgi:hypothetical protein